MTFRRQLVIGHIALLIVTTMIGAIAMIAIHVTSVRLEQVASDIASDVVAIEQLRFEAEQVVATSRGYLLSGDPKILDRFEGAVTRVDQTLAGLHERADVADMTQVDEVTHAYVAAARTAAALRKTSDDPRTVMPFFEETLTPARAQFEATVTGFVRRRQDAFEHASAEASGFARRMPRVIGATTALALALGVVLAWRSVRRLDAQYAREHQATAAARRATELRDETLAVVSHDLRSPLAAILLSTTLLDTNVVDAPGRKHVAMIRRSSEHMERLIEELLDAAKLETGTLELASAPLTVAALSDAVVSLFETRMAHSDVVLTTEAVDREAMIQGDHDRLLQVLSNLVSNALKFTPPGGRITLSARTEGTGVRIAVTDTGPGVPAADAPHVFERYWQGRRRDRGGLGLGLYICKQIVEAHHGRIGLDSQAGDGSTFWFVIPGVART